MLPMSPNTCYLSPRSIQHLLSRSGLPLGDVWGTFPKGTPFEGPLQGSFSGLGRVISRGTSPSDLRPPSRMAYKRIGAPASTGPAEVPYEKT